MKTNKIKYKITSGMLGLALVLNPSIIYAKDNLNIDQSTYSTENESLEEEQKDFNTLETQDSNGLNIGDEIIGEAVKAGSIPTPTVKDIFIHGTTISGGNLHRVRVNGKTERATVHVTLKDKNNQIKAESSVTPTRGSTWTVNLPKGITVEEGDTVSVYQEFDENKSDEVVVTEFKEALKDKYKDTLKMPSGEIWIEQTSSNHVNDDEQAEAVRMFKEINTAIASDIKSVKFSINTTEHAYYEVTYTDGSTSDKIEATNLIIKQVTETSRTPEIDNITVVDNVIKGKISGQGPFGKTKVQLILNVAKNELNNYKNKCIVDKDSSKPIGVELQSDGSFSYTLTGNETLNLDQTVGVSIKEQNKFVSCSTSIVKPVIVNKTEVKDPRKLTADDKKAIDTVIRQAYTVNGVSKLPSGSDLQGGVPAIIQIDDTGNTKIFSGGDVKGDWDNEGNFIPETNEDGSYKVVEGAQPKIIISGKDIVRNLKPEIPEVAITEDKKNITIVPNKKDTDANVITVSYIGEDGKEVTVVAEKNEQDEWNVTQGKGTVNKIGAITIKTDNVKANTEIKATVKDKGGLSEEDKEPLTSDEGKIKFSEADKVLSLGGLNPVVMKKWVGDKLDWKDGVEAKDKSNELAIKKLLSKATFEEINARNTDKASGKEGFEGKIKVKFEDGSEIIVENQVLYVSDFITSSTNKNAPNDAIEVEFKLGDGVKVEDKDPNSGEVTNTTEGNKDNPVLYKKYKIKPNTDLSNYKNPTLGKTIFELIDETEKDGYTEPVWNDSNKGTNFVVNANNKTFISTATQLFEVTFDSNGGDGSMEGAKVKANNTYTLPENKFTPVTGKKFDGWKVGNESKIRKAGETITITDNVVITANWVDDKITKVTTEVIKAKTKYETDDTLEFEKQKVITTAVDGEKEITTVSQKGKDDIVTEKTTKEKVDGLVKIGNKKVEVKKDDDITITTTTTYEVNPNTGELINPKVVVKKSMPAKPIEDIAKVTKVTKEVIKAKTKYETDDTLEFEKQKVIKEAVDGEKKITTVSQKGKDDIVTEKTTKEAVDGLVKIGNKKVEITHDGDITITTTTTYEVNPNTGELINPKTEVKKSTQPKPIEDIAKTTKVTKEPIKAETKYQTDDTLEFGKQKVITVAVDGEKEITTVSQKDKDDIVTEKTTKEAVDGLVKIGNKKVEVKKDGDITITTTTTYEVNPNTGELINPKVEVKKTTQPKPIEDIAKTTKVTKEVIKAKTKYETDDTLEFGKQKVIKEAVNGEKEKTTVSQKGKDDIVTEKTIKEAVDGLVKIGNKKVEKDKEGNTIITTYEVNPNTGELINPKVEVIKPKTQEKTKNQNLIQKKQPSNQVVKSKNNVKTGVNGTGGTILSAILALIGLGASTRKKKED